MTTGGFGAAESLGAAMALPACLSHRRTVTDGVLLSCAEDVEDESSLRLALGVLQSRPLDKGERELATTDVTPGVEDDNVKGVVFIPFCS